LGATGSALIYGEDVLHMLENQAYRGFMAAAISSGVAISD
jgi:hypothetical protein